MSIEIKSFLPGNCPQFFVPDLGTPYVAAYIGVERRSGWFKKSYHIGLEGLYRQVSSTDWRWMSSGYSLPEYLSRRVCALERKYHYDRTLSEQNLALSQKPDAGGGPGA